MQAESGGPVPGGSPAIQILIQCRDLFPDGIAASALWRNTSVCFLFESRDQLGDGIPEICFLNEFQVSVPWRNPEDLLTDVDIIS